MAELARVEAQVREGASIVAVRGEIDFSNVDAVEVEVRKQIASALRVAVDLRETGYLDSAGVNFLFRLNRELQADGRHLTIVVDADSNIRRMLQLSGLEAVARIAGTLPQSP